MIIVDALLYVSLLFISVQLIKIITLLAVQVCCDRPDIKFCRFIHLQYLNLCARFKSGEVIALMDYKDQIIYSVAQPMHLEDVKLSYINWQLQISPIWLHEDGSVTRPHNEISHIKYWLPVNLEKRTFMILQGARGFDVNPLG